MAKTTTNLTFHLVGKESYETVLAWLGKPHVNAFFQGQGLQNTLDDLERHVTSRTPHYQHWIAYHDDVPFGYLITSSINPQKEEDNRFAKHMGKEETAITLDLLIGEEQFLGKGLAPKMIRDFLLDKFSHVSQVFIDPEVANPKATHVYEKVGFKKLEQFIAEWHPVPHWLMHLKMAQLKK